MFASTFPISQSDDIQILPMIYKPWTEPSGSVRSGQCKTSLHRPTAFADVGSDVYRLIGQGTIEENIYERQSEF